MGAQTVKPWAVHVINRRRHKAAYHGGRKPVSEMNESELKAYQADPAKANAPREGGRVIPERQPTFPAGIAIKPSLLRRIKKYPTSRKVRAFLGLRAPLAEAKDMPFWRGYVPAFDKKGRKIRYGKGLMETASNKAVIDAVRAQKGKAAAVALERSQKKGFLARLAGKVRGLFSRKAG